MSPPGATMSAIAPPPTMPPTCAALSTIGSWKPMIDLDRAEQHEVPQERAAPRLGPRAAPQDEHDDERAEQAHDRARGADGEPDLLRVQRRRRRADQAARDVGDEVAQRPEDFLAEASEHEQRVAC